LIIIGFTVAAIVYHCREVKKDKEIFKADNTPPILTTKVGAALLDELSGKENAAEIQKFLDTLPDRNIDQEMIDALHKEAKWCIENPLSTR
jgi:hypothetical protein